MKQFLKSIFYSGIIIIILFEVLNVYFIMPMPGSQEIKSIDIAYFLYNSRWYFRIACAIMIAAGIISAFDNKLRLLPALSLIAAIVISLHVQFQNECRKYVQTTGKSHSQIKIGKYGW